MKKYALPLALAFGVFCSMFVVAIVSLMLPILEYLFKVTTDITLLEFLDLDQPLMKNLMIDAPGTYHHSVIVGNLVESAAEAVEVNPLLAKVSAYYHDVGKIKMPDYFVENQSTGENKHTKLTPHMSTMILISHVKEGVELAMCAWEECEKASRSNSKYCSRECSNKNARARHRLRKTSPKPA